MNFFYKMTEIRFMLIPYSLAIIAILIIALIIIHLIQRKNKKIKNLTIENITLKVELKRQTSLKEKYENQIVSSELSHGRTKRKKETKPTESEILNNWVKILNLQRLENESDEDFRKRLSEKIPH